jgi:putative transposase
MLGLFAHEIGRLTTQVAWLKKNLASNLHRDERVALLEREESGLPLSVQADLLGVSRASLYYQAAVPSDVEIVAKRRIDEIYTDRPFYGSRKIAAQMQREGFMICRNTVAKYMKEMGVAAIYPGPNLSKRDSQHKVYPYLLRGLAIERPNAVWGVDITYIRLNRGWMYLVAVLDWYSRYVVSWELDQTLEMPFVLSAVDKALETATPQIWNSDQGSHFTSPQYVERLFARDIKISMDGKGRALDNVFTGRLWRSVKYEEVYLNEYDSPRMARQGLGRYLHFYNEERVHQALAYKTPAAVYERR